MSEEQTLKVLCPFCNAVQSAEVEAQLESIHSGCPTCGYGNGADFVVEVSCNNCHRVMYRKECGNG